MTFAWEEGARNTGRLAAVERTGLVRTGPEDSFDRLTELAVELIGVPRACITLVDAERTTAKSSVGFPEGPTLFAPVELSFCRFVVGSGRPLIVDNAHLDERTRGARPLLFSVQPPGLGSPSKMTKGPSSGPSVS
jgi:GAF domain-containing protein